MVAALAQRFDVEAQRIWAEIRAVTLDRIDLQRVVLSALGGFTSVGITVFLVVIYAGFLLGERGTFPAKISTALTDPESAAKALRVITDINSQISQYLAVKTLINLILGVLSFSILWLLEVDFALFWAITIALLNYIPYVGSYLGVAFPVILSLGQFASTANDADPARPARWGPDLGGQRARAALDRPAAEHEPLRRSRRAVGLGRAVGGSGGDPRDPDDLDPHHRHLEFRRDALHRRPSVRARQDQRAGTFRREVRLRLAGSGGLSHSRREANMDEGHRCDF
jgi:hypothetical protein